MAVFSVEEYENVVIEGANETKATPLPEGSYSDVIIDSVRIKKVKRNDGTEAPVLEIIHHLTNPSEELKQLLGGRDKITVRQDIWLDVTETGAIAFGPNQNLGLGRLREAAGMNSAKKFSFNQLVGVGPLKIHVGIKTQESTGDSFNTVTKVEKS